MNLGIRMLSPREFLLKWSVKIMYRESGEVRITKVLGITYNSGGLSGLSWKPCSLTLGRGQLKCDDTRAETRFRLSPKRTSPFKSAGASVQSTTGSRGLRFSGSNVVYTMCRDSMKGTGYPLHSPVSPSLPLPCVTWCHHISTEVCVSLLLSLQSAPTQPGTLIWCHE